MLNHGLCNDPEIKYLTVSQVKVISTAIYSQQSLIPQSGKGKLKKFLLKA